MTMWTNQVCKDLVVNDHVDRFSRIYFYPQLLAQWYIGTLHVVDYNYVGWKVSKKIHKNPELGTTHPFSFKVYNGTLVVGKCSV